MIVSPVKLHLKLLFSRLNAEVFFSHATGVLCRFTDRIFRVEMNRCLCFILVKTCLLLSTGRRADPARQLEMETVTRSNMSTLLLKTEVIPFVVPSPTEHKLHTSTGVSPTTAQPAADPRFHVGSFIGGMMLALVITLAVILGYRLTCSRREVRYRAIEEHDAII